MKRFTKVCCLFFLVSGRLLSADVPVLTGNSIYELKELEAGIIGSDYTWNSIQDKKCIEVKNEKARESFFKLELSVDGKNTEEIFLNCQMKGENIKSGEKAWEKGRIFFIFQDVQGKSIGKRDVCFPEGTFDWKEINKSLIIPEETSKIVLFMGLANCSGTAYFSSVKLFFSARLAADESNMVKNGGFEESYTDTLQPRYWQLCSWNVEKEGNINDKIARDGNCSLEFKDISDNPPNATVMYMQKVSVKPSTEYLFSGWMKNLESRSGKCFFMVCSQDMKKIFMEIRQSILQGAKWTKYPKSFKTDETTNEVMICCGIYGAYGDTYFDDISLMEQVKNN